MATPARVVLVSDTHLSPDAPEAEANWAAVARYVVAAAPDFVIHLGDLSLDGARNAADLDYARRQLDRLPVPFYVVPGNHDVGDNPFPGAPDGSSVDDDRRQRWLDVVGADRWSLAFDGWTLLAINAQLAGSGLAAEEEQWSWLAEQVRLCGDGQRIALVSHKPLTAEEAELAAAPPYRFLPAAARSRLTEIFGGRSLPLVLSGHVHQFRQLSLSGTAHLWAPTTWAVLPDDVQPVLGAKRCGVVSVVFDSSTPPEAKFAEPDGIVQLTVRTDIPDPYHRH
ncbi:MAG TPA: metallophosphoesterase [Streptosporangiaceae bacterium]|nr:metallophosphoesterase [Streptosporangiaceae bacterium]